MAYKKNCLLATFLVSICNSAYGFVVNHSKRTSYVSASLVEQKRFPSGVTLKAGFGGDGQKKKAAKIKPKQQWDRYGKLKREQRYLVSVRVISDDDSDWLEVGSVKSKGNEYTDIAVARQRALISEHARRLFPLQVSIKDKIEWAYRKSDEEEWVIVDKSVLESKDIPEGVEKMIGFEGNPDPASGYYCVYNEGRLVTSESDMNMERTSKKLQ